jgi:hypothetical protein
MSDTTDMNQPPHEESRKLTLASIEVMIHRLNCACSNIRLGHYQEPPIGHLAYMVDQLKDIEEVLCLQPNFGIQPPPPPEPPPPLEKTGGLTWRGKYFVP